MPFNIGPGELLLILAIALLVIGPGRLPDVGAALGKSLREFRKASTEMQESINVVSTAPAPAKPAASPAPASPAAPVPDQLSEPLAEPNTLSGSAPVSAGSTEAASETAAGSRAGA